MSEARIAIVGGGIAGLRGALELSKAGFSPTLIEHNPPNGLENPAKTYSTPIVFDSLAEEYGLQLDQNARVDRFESSFLTSRRRAIVLLLNAYLNFFKHYLYAPSMHEIRSHLYTEALDNPAINLIKGKVTDVLLGGNEVQGIEIDNKNTIPTDLVVDASGRTGVVSKKIAEHNPKLVSEKKMPQPSTVLGAYVTIPRETLEAHLPEGNHTIYSEQLPSNLQFIFSPAAYERENKNNLPWNNKKYLLLIEGNRAIIEYVYAETRGTVAERRLKVIRALADGSRWEPILDPASNPEETILFFYSEAVLRRLKAQRVALVGDARLHTSPIVGAGLFFLSDDVRRLTNALKHNPDNMERAVNVYERSQIFPTFLKWLYSKKKYQNSYTAKSNLG